MGLIYKITNLINGKIYVGQTTQTLEQRWKHHLSQLNDNFYFHRAIKKYGKENFYREVIEDNISKEKLNEREQYWIQYFDSYVKNGKGYNATLGGDSASAGNIKLSIQEVEEIRILLKTTNQSMVDLAKKYNISFYQISGINTGKCWRDKTCSYPLRPLKRKFITYEEFINIIEMLQTRLFSAQYIANKFQITSSLISHINTGTYAKFSYPEGINFPIAPTKTVTYKVTSAEIILKALLEYLQTDLTRAQAADKYNIGFGVFKLMATTTGSRIKPYLQNLKYPLKENVDYNIKQIQNKLNLYDKYK